LVFSEFRLSGGEWPRRQFGTCSDSEMHDAARLESRMLESSCG
jgi:hypothetical protein